MFLSYRNQSIDLQSKSMNCFYMIGTFVIKELRKRESRNWINCILLLDIFSSEPMGLFSRGLIYNFIISVLANWVGLHSDGVYTQVSLYVAVTVFNIYIYIYIYIYIGIINNKCFYDQFFVLSLTLFSQFVKWKFWKAGL